MKFKNTQAKAKNDGKYKNINNIAFGLGRCTWRILYIRVFFGSFRSPRMVQSESWPQAKATAP